MSIASLKVRAKKIVQELPYPVGRFISHIPFNIILGNAFSKFKKERKAFSKYNENQKRAYQYQKIQKIVTYAYQNIPFYNSFYKKNDFHPDHLQGFESIQEIPILTKDDLIAFNLEKRSNSSQASNKINTGGTTGEPLEFYIENNAMAREWSHMLHIWAKVGYKRTDLKLNFRGRNIGQNAYKYNPVGNEYIINTFADLELISEALLALLQHKTIRYLHGYPSAIYEFAKFIQTHKPALVHRLNKTLKGILLGSEYPALVYRNLIEDVFDCPSISWYGHSEMCILAYEKTKQQLYEPMGSYGYCEAVPDADGNCRLIGTSFYNTASPFIRYDTGDLVSPVNQNKGYLKSFKIEQGRIGEFVLDKKGHRTSLTALIFGRHHPVFGKAKFVQVHQPNQGKVTILLTKAEGCQLTNKEARANFDASHVDLDITFRMIDEPYRTQSGKVPLLVNKTKIN